VSFTAILWLAWVPLQSTQAAPSVIVSETYNGPGEHRPKAESWYASEDELVSGERRVPLEALKVLRERILQELCVLEKDPDASCIQELGLDAESFAAHRDAWLSAALPEYWTIGGVVPELPPDAKAQLTWKRWAREIAHWVCAGRLQSLHGVGLQIELPGDPVIVVSGPSEVPWTLPWDVRVGDRRWHSADVGISRAAQPFAPTDGAFVDHLDGERYWAVEFWSDRRFWNHSVGRVLDEALCREAYERLEGWGIAAGFLRVNSAVTGKVDGAQHAMHFDLSWRSRSPIERVRWWAPGRGRELAHTWIELLTVWQDAKHTVIRESWIDDWKRAGQARTVTLDLVGLTIADDMLLETLTLPAWRAAEFHGRPDWRLQLRRGREVSATVFLSRDQPGALIASSHPGAGAHWLDPQEFRFHPHGDPPTFGRVDAVGNFERRTLPRRR
jgi:hypothetical protein